MQRGLIAIHTFFENINPPQPRIHSHASMWILFLPLSLSVSLPHFEMAKDELSSEVEYKALI